MKNSAFVIAIVTWALLTARGGDEGLTFFVKALIFGHRAVANGRKLMIVDRSCAD